MAAPDESHERHRHRHHHHHHRRSRSRSPRRHHSHSHRKRSPELNPNENPYARPVVLPYGAKPLTKHDLDAYTPVFASYLDIQKQLDLYALDTRELRGRWKSFVNRWNAGELAQGWYDPSTKAKADAAALEDAEAYAAEPPTNPPADPADSEPDSDYGPPPPPGAPYGARPATTSELVLRDELVAEDAAAARSTLRAERKADRAAQRERLDELAPRAEPGSRERMLEKRRERGDAVRAFKDARAEAGGVAEVADADLLGQDDDGDGIKRRRREEERRKTERQVRKDEMLRARAAEREERLKGLREKEDRTMERLKAIARERFG